MERERYLREMEPLLGKKICKEIRHSKSICIGFTKKGNKHLYSDTLGRTKDLQKDELKNLHLSLEKAVFITSAPLMKDRKDGIVKFYYFKDNVNELYYNVAEKIRIHKNGKISLFRFLYSITNKIRVK
jgi:hypothetical protein